MSSSFSLPGRNLIALVLLLAVSGCSTQFNWRVVRADDMPVTVLLPAKPTSHAADIELNGNKVNMKMTATEVGTVNFAVAGVSISDPAQRADALLAMQTAMVSNINGTIRTQKQVKLEGGQSATEIMAAGAMGPAKTPVLMAARFVEHGTWLLQVVAIGPGQDLSQEVIDTFLSSLVLN